VPAEEAPQGTGIRHPVPSPVRGSASRAASPRVGSGAMTSYRKLADGTLGHETLHVVSPGRLTAHILKAL